MNSNKKREFRKKIKNVSPLTKVLLNQLEQEQSKPGAEDTDLVEEFESNALSQQRVIPRRPKEKKSMI